MYDKWRQRAPMVALVVLASCLATASGHSERGRFVRAADIPIPEASVITTAASVTTQRAPVAPGSNASGGPSLMTMLSVDTAPCTLDGHCICSVKTPPACSIDEEYRAIVALRERIDEVNVRASGALLRQLSINMTLLQSRIERLQAALQTQSVAVSQTELNFLRLELSLVSTLVAQLEANITTNLTISLRREVDAIISGLTAIESKNPIAVQSNLQLEINALKERLARCKTETTSIGATIFPGDTLPFNEPYGACTSARNITIGPQVTHRYRSWQSWWGKDPRPTSDATRQQIYEIRTSGARDATVSTWSNYSDFSSARSEFLFRQSGCPFMVHGRKNVIVNGSLYYYEAFSQKTVWKMDLNGCKTTRLSITIDSPDFNLYLNRETYVDLNYDETGLYMTYTDTARVGELVIAKINPETMTVVGTWETGRQKSTLANVFFVCGRMYTTDSFTTTHLTGKQFGFDTNTGEEFFVDLDVESRFSGVRQLSYNPRERLIFGFDNQHLVTYQVFFP